MALINTDKKFIFFHLFKCAGNSMRQLLNTHPTLCYEYYGIHSSPRDVKELLIMEKKEYIFNEYFKFTIVRNPFDWLFSTYKYILSNTLHPLFESFKVMSFNDFVKYYVEYMMLNDGISLGSNKCTNLYDYVSDSKGNLLLDYIGKYETINNDIVNILQSVKIKNKELPFINVTPNNDSDYRKYYNQESRDIVEKVFSKDLEYFNYKF